MIASHLVIAQNLVKRNLRNEEVVNRTIASQLRLCQLQLRVIDIN